MRSRTLISEKRMKQRARALSKDLKIKQTEALDMLSRNEGYDNWQSYRKALEVQGTLSLKIPDPSTNYVEDGDVEMSEEDYEDYDNERSTDLDDESKLKVIKNKKVLIKSGIEFSVFEPTITGLKKSILDATQPVRSHFLLEGFHNYRIQAQGKDGRIYKEAVLHSGTTETIKSKVSLYRPNTKNGDPRMWFRKLSEIAVPGDQVAIIVLNDIAHLINLSRVELSELQDKDSISKLLQKYNQKKNSTAEELLGKLRELAKNPHKTLRSGDTGVGYTLETLLDIDANVDKGPDYKGEIEIKAGRGVKNRTTLFAQVADWKISPCKRSAEILDKFGYQRDEDFKLYCTVSTQKDNSQGLNFKYDKANDQIQEWFRNEELVAVWPGDLLRGRLHEKHSETFWVEVKSEVIDGSEHFHILSVTHTRSPLASQLVPLIESGVITMDHLIKRNGKTNRVSEKGPLFKMNKRDLDLLFPTPIKYKLI